jgi:MFS family permease
MHNDKQHRTRTLWLIGVLHAFTHLYGVALLPLYLRIEADLGLRSVEQATLLVTVMGFAYFLPSYGLGVLADRWSRKRLLASGLAINGLGFVVLAAAPNYPVALLAVALAGFGGSFYHPAATALIARMFPEARGKALGLVGIGASIGFFLGPIYSGWRVTVTGSWRSPVLELGLLGIAAAALFAWLGPAERATPSSPPIDEHTRPTPLFPAPALWAFFLSASFFLSLRDFAGSGMATSASLFFQNAHGLNPKITGLALSGIFIASAISNPLFGRLSDGGRIRWMTLVLAMAAVLMSIFPRVPADWSVPVLLAYGFFFMAGYPITEAALMEAVPDPVRGRVFGLFITIGGLVGNLAHWLVGDWAGRLGAKAALPSGYYGLYGTLSLLVVISLAALPFLHGLRKREHIHGSPTGAAALSPLRSPEV